MTDAFALSPEDAFALSPEEAAQRSDDETARLTECATEPLRTIGRIQSHGFLLGVDEASGVVVLASANAEQFLGRTLRDESERLEWILVHASAVDPVTAELDGRVVDVIVHRGTEPLLVEFEPVVPELEYMRTGVVNAIQTLAGVNGGDDLYWTAAREIKALTGFDRVMCYDFHDDGHGQVVADEREPGMEPYFGLHFPASDIPMQARALYLEKRSRVIADTEDSGVEVLSLLPEQETVDLGLTELRAVSGHHLTFMRNMGQAATFSLSLVVEGRLVGLITCAHRSPRRLPALLRRSLEVLATQLSIQVSALRRNGELQRRLDAQERRAAVIASLFERVDPGEALTTGERTLLDIVPSDGAVLRLDGSIHTVGVVPPPEALIRCAERLGPGRHVVETLPALDPAAAGEMPGIAGLLVVPLRHGDDVLIFLRSEVVQTVEWLGDQRAENRDHALSPRRSFSAWRESVTGRSLPWGPYAQDAFDFAESLSSALESRTHAELAVRDPLTGLHNRRFLEEYLSGAADAERTGLTVIFFDVDDFKSINDNHGHNVGDIVLRVIGQRLHETVRKTDWVVRLGGDEFLVVCPDTELAPATDVAERALAAISRPMHVEGVTLRMQASAGVVVGGADVVSAADAAMYRAKNAGGGRVSA